MLTPLEFFQLHCGVKIDPGADAKSVLMRTYPHSSKDVLVRFGGPDPARFLITEDGAKIWATIRFDPPIQGISLALQSERKTREWMTDILMSPPKPPFLASTLGQAGSDIDFWRLTLSNDLIVFSGSTKSFGANIVMIDRPLYLETVKWFEQTGVSVSDLLRVNETQHKFKSGLIGGEHARTIMAKIKTPQDVLQSYPGVRDPMAMKLAYFAATEWKPQ